MSQEKPISKQLKAFSSRPITERKTWYTPAAEAYDRARPKYPQEICDRILHLADLPENPKLLEIGCGPGTATVNFAPTGFDILCLEPNPVFCELARRNCAEYSNVEIRNVALEEWPLEAGQFDLVYAANAFHWIPPELGYSKVADALKPGASLALIWNMNLEPSLELWEQLKPMFEAHAPKLGRYEGVERQAEILLELGQMMVESGRFSDPTVESICCDRTYSSDGYLTLLSTYSPYLALSEEMQLRLFEGLRAAIAKQSPSPSIQLFNRCGFQLAQKR